MWMRSGDQDCQKDADCTHSKALWLGSSVAGWIRCTRCHDYVPQWMPVLVTAEESGCGAACLYFRSTSFLVAWKSLVRPGASIFTK